MNITVRFAAAMLGMSLVAGCSTMTEGEFNNLHATLQGSPAVKRSVIKECVADERNTPADKKKNYSAFMNVSPDRYEMAICNRLVNALADGRITYADYRKLSSPTADSSKVIKIMQGR